VYVDDYTQFEPLPAALRLRLPSARGFLLDSEREALEAAEAADAAADASGAEFTAKRDAGDQAPSADVDTDAEGLATDTRSDEKVAALRSAPGARVDVPAADPAAVEKQPSLPVVAPGGAPPTDSISN